MKLAISHIAWTAGEEPDVADRLAALGVEGVEVAPTRAFADPAGARPGEIAAYRAFWEERKISIVAMQALLFGRPELTLFASADARARTLTYLRAVVRAGGALGARALVFGSPRNRARGDLPFEEAFALATDFFRDLAATAEEAGTCVCIEPNPERYGADFVTNSREALRLVETVNRPGFGLHLDAACALLAGEDLPERIRASAHVLRHVHLSEPDLAPVQAGGTLAPRPIFRALRDMKYTQWISIEQRSRDGADNAAAAEAAVRLVQSAV